MSHTTRRGLLATWANTWYVCIRFATCASRRDRNMARPWVHGPNYRRLAPLVRRAANTNPDARCWRCNLTLAEHTPHANGKPARWTAGHRHDGQPDHTLTLTDLAAEASTCNTSAGASWGNTLRREPRSSGLWR